jgi:SIR2-like domain
MSNSEPQSSQTDGWGDEDWNTLLSSIRFKKCTPFLGAGASTEIIPTGQQLARRLAQDYKYPFRERHNLARVAQYGAIDVAELSPKFKIIEIIYENIQTKGLPKFENPDEMHRVVADLPIPVYITTNYDDFMFQALESVGKEPRLEVCKWYEAKKPKEGRQEPANEDDKFRPTPKKPVVFHLHGHLEDPNSIVITEDDYLNFLINISEDPDVIPNYIQAAFTNSTFLFIGYSLEDLNFKVLFRKLAEEMRRSGGNRHVSVQLAPRQFETPGKLQQRSAKQLEYLKRQLHNQSVKVYWGSAEQFAEQLRIKWEAFPHGP